MRIEKAVTASSSDAEIIAAVQAAGEKATPHSRRKHDREQGWVIPNDIGYSSKQDTSLLRRLHALVEKGLLKRRYTYRTIEDHTGDVDRGSRRLKSRPRFRVPQK